MNREQNYLDRVRNGLINMIGKQIMLGSSINIIVK